MKEEFYTEQSRVLLKDRKYIHNQSKAIAAEELNFLDGKQLGEVDIFIESGDVRRKVRRIIEKRVCQEMHKCGKIGNGNKFRYKSKRIVSNQFKNIYGGVPVGFVPVGAAA